MENENALSPPTLRRHKLADLLIVVLVGVAFEEMAGPMAHTIRTEGFGLDVLLFLIFLFTTIRFFIGCQFHLLDDDVVNKPGLWFYDFMWIVFEMTLIIFLGAFCTVHESQGARVHFVTVLNLIFFVDVLWISSQWVLGKLYPPWRRTLPEGTTKKGLGAKLFPWWRRTKIPWEWAVLNSVLIVAIYVLRYSVDDFYSTAGIVLLFILNVLVFVADVFLTDFADLLGQGK